MPFRHLCCFVGVSNLASLLYCKQLFACIFLIPNYKLVIEINQDQQVVVREL